MTGRKAVYILTFPVAFLIGLAYMAGMEHRILKANHWTFKR